MSSEGLLGNSSPPYKRTQDWSVNPVFLTVDIEAEDEDSRNCGNHPGPMRNAAKAKDGCVER